MLELSPETEALARRLAETQHISVDDAVRRILESGERAVSGRPTKDVSPAAIAERIERINTIVKEISALPVLDPLSVEDIVEDINAL